MGAAELKPHNRKLADTSIATKIEVSAEVSARGLEKRSMKSMRLFSRKGSQGRADTSIYTL